MQNLILFGGTFNPFHNGHAAILETLHANFPHNKIMLMPNYLPPLKEDTYLNEDIKNQFLVHRINMLKLVLNLYPFCELDLYETKRKTTSYTIDTLKHFRKYYLNLNLYYVIGSDNFFNFHNWKDYLELTNLATFIVVNRTEIKLEQYQKYLKEFLNKEVGKKFIFFHIDPVVVSATQIRTRIKNNESINDLVPETIENYIVRNKLYSF